MKKKENVKLGILFAIMILSFAIVCLITSFIEANLDFTEWAHEIRRNVVIAWAIISIILNLIYIGVTCIE